ncbi:hypothetical protein [Thiomonas sp.]
MPNLEEMANGWLEACQKEITEQGDIDPTLFLFFQDGTVARLRVLDLEHKAQLAESLPRLVARISADHDGSPLVLAMFGSTGWSSAQREAAPSQAADRQEVLVVEGAVQGRAQLVVVPIRRAENQTPSFGEPVRQTANFPFSRFLLPLFVPDGPRH